MAGDQYNAYRYDPIDEFEKERRGEHRGEVLNEDTKFIDEEGILNQSILVTRIELANGLKWKSNFTYEQGDYKVTSDPIFDVDELFQNYGDYDQTTHRIKAIRVWSGNDHWLLPKETANRCLWVLPLNIPITDRTLFDIVYWPQSYGNLKKELDDSTFNTKASAILYYDGHGDGSFVSGMDTADVESLDDYREVRKLATKILPVSDSTKSLIASGGLLVRRDVLSLTELIAKYLSDRNESEHKDVVNKKKLGNGDQLPEALELPDSIDDLEWDDKIIVPILYRNNNNIFGKEIFVFDSSTVEYVYDDDEYVV